MKTVLKSIYVVAILFIGYTIYGTSKTKRTQHLYADAANDYTVSKKITKEEYIERTMVSANIVEYIKEPLFSYSFSEESSFNFTFEGYSFKQGSGSELEIGVKFFLFDFTTKNFEDLVTDKTRYLDNLSLADLSIQINTNDHSIDKKLTLVLNENRSIHTLDFYDNSIYLAKDKDEFYVKTHKGTESFSKFNSISFNLIDKTNPKYDPAKSPAENKEYIKTILLGRISTENQKDFYYKATITELGKIFNSDGINTTVSKYKDVIASYNENDNKVVSNFKLLSNYNNIIYKELGIYIAIGTIITFLLFFYTPIKKLILKKKQSK